MMLKDGDRIAVVGAGPAGTFFSYLAQDLAKRRGLDVTITIFDGKDFVRPGPPGCNMCAGVLSETLTEKLHQIGLDPPGDRVQLEIENYLLSTPFYDISLLKRRRRFPIYTVYRGNGPRGLTGEINVSFDDYLLEQCQARGIRIVREMVQEIHLSGDLDAPITLLLSPHRQPFEAALVVIACGLNTRLLNYLATAGFGYRPPRMVHTCQAEIKVPDEFIQKKAGHSITTFALRTKNIQFAAFTPKKHHLTLTVVGKKDVSRDDLLAVLNHPRIRSHYLQDLPLEPNFCFCRPQIAVSPAQNFFTNRLVVIGDAAFSRYYKSGIESAFDTARLAAACAFEHGVARPDFKKHYLNREARAIKNSSIYGKVVFHCYDLIYHSRFLSAGLVSLLSHRGHSYSSRKMIQALWGVFTGTVSYRRVLRNLFNPLVQARLTAELLRITARRIFLGKGALDSGNTVSCEVEALGPLGSGQTVAIIGGGPGGVGCALALKKFAREKDLDLKVIIYEGKEFETQTHYNQCVGVLSPPIIEILEQELGLPFPHHLVQREISGYVLHSDGQSLLLPGDHAPSVSVRRVAFDSYLLSQARSRGIEIITSRVTDLEITDDSVMIYSESDNRRADVVVGAFGLDDGTAKVFERITSYRQPRFIHSIVTKIHPGDEIVAHFENYIHAFLPSLREIEFGAVTPKKNHLTINVAGAHVTAQSLQNFLNLKEVLAVLPPTTTWHPDEVSYFKGKFPTQVARAFYGNRYIIIGDAAGLLRPFKGKGVNTSILTGMRAARTMLDVGISKKAFEVFYRKCRDITDDLPYGKFMRFVALRLANWKLLDPIITVAAREERLKSALFDSVSAHRSYKSIFHNLWDLRLFWNLGRAILKQVFSQLVKIVHQPGPAKQHVSPGEAEKPHSDPNKT